MTREIPTIVEQWPRTAWLVVVFILCCLQATVIASTIHVEVDGTGDFTNIQPAVEAAASGDTIRIGPGVYDAFQSYTTTGGVTTDAIIAVDWKDLVLIGSGRNER